MRRQRTPPQLINVETLPVPLKIIMTDHDHYRW